MQTIRIGGVPEHFNFPWQYALASGRLNTLDFKVHWTYYPGGTGAMCEELSLQNLDIALVLTEGLLTAIGKGLPAYIGSWYVKTPLHWGIFTHPENTKAQTEILKDQKYAISRMGSGSHLMAALHAQSLGQTVEESQFVVVQNLQGALASLQKQETDLFFWEKFTTQPFVQTGQVKQLGMFPSPWPCFSWAIHQGSYEQYGPLILQIMDIMYATIAELDTWPHLAIEIAQKYNLDPIQAEQWLAQTVWATDNKIELVELEKVYEALSRLNMIDNYYLIKDYLLPSHLNNINGA